MDRDTALAVVDYAERGGFDTADITGGAPELNPNLTLLIDRLADVVPRVMFRANLTALTDEPRGELIDLLVRRRVVIIASFPSLNPKQTDVQRGGGVFERSIETMKILNELGYGLAGTNLELNLASNPGGAFLPPEQAKTEMHFRRRLFEKHGVIFNSLYTFANAPLGRFRQWLEDSGNYEAYYERLARSFNPCVLSGVMCRYQVSVAWDGYLYDCDFNIAAGLPLDGRRIHVTDMKGAPEPGSSIAVGDHCYACTAGAGFTCGGAIAAEE
jgi:radical SAM/Cys-rich protein